MNTTTQSSPSPVTTDFLSVSRGFGRAAARSTVGRGPQVLATALRKARVAFPACDAAAFVAGFQAERRDMRG